MSKVSEAKERQGWLKKAPTCSQCKHFSMDMVEKTVSWMKKPYLEEKNLRCSLGGFKVGKSNWCAEFDYPESENES